MKKWVGLWIGTAVLIGPAWSFACSIGRCEDISKMSAPEFGLPANTPSILIDFDKDVLTNADVILREVGGDEITHSLVRLTGWEVLTPDTPFEPNTAYVLSRGILEQECGSFEMPFTTGGVEEFPQTLGNLELVEIKEGQVELDSSECSSVVDAVYADVELNVSDDAEIWRGGLIIQTFVNGERWKPSSMYLDTYTPGESWMGYGKDRVFVLCDSDSSLQVIQSGAHEIQMVGTIPGTEIRLESNTVTVELECESSTDDDLPDMGDPDMGDEVAASNDSEGCNAVGGLPFALSLLILGGLRRRQ